MRFIDRDRMRVPEELLGKQAEDARVEVAAFIEQTQSSGPSRRIKEPHWLDENLRFMSRVARRFDLRCAYCERHAPPEHSQPAGIIGRHRPKTLAEDEKGNTDLLAYSWLMYDWENILWLCSICARQKGNRFFVQGRRGQPSTPIKELREFEGELLLDPCFHKVDDHLTFEISGYVRAKSEKGEATIQALDLNSIELLGSRRKSVEVYAEALAFGLMIIEDDILRPGETSTAVGHPGATTAAIRSVANAFGLDDRSSVQDLSDWLNALSSEDRPKFISTLMGGEYPAEPTFHAELPKKQVSSSPEIYSSGRIPNIRQLPNALNPVTRVEIKNFKALSHIDFDLPERVPDEQFSPCMLLLGENATGKSSVLEAMALAIIGSGEAAALNELLKHEVLAPKGLIHRPDPYHWEKTETDMAVRLSFLGSATPVELIAQAGAERFNGVDHCSKVVLGYGPRRYFTSNKSRRLRAPAHRIRSLFDARDMIANPIHWLSKLKSDNFFAAARALRVVLMLDDADDFELDDNPDTPGQIYIRQNGNRVALRDLSVGYKSVIAMVCDIIRELLYHYDNLEFAHAIVFIDEIETHLHPRWKMQIMSLLREAFPKVQFIVTTHDPLCLRGMYDGEVFVLRRSDKDNVERVMDLPSIRGMRAEQILTSEFFGLGSTDPETDARLARYNVLAARIENLSEAERAEMERLSAALDDGMVLGSTLREQAYAEALKKRVEEHRVRPTQAPSPGREDLRESFSALFTKRLS